MLIRNTALEMLGTAPTPLVNVEELCRSTHLGRNTVYGLFESAAKLTASVLDEAEAELFRNLPSRGLQTPIEGLRAFARDWLQAAARDRVASSALWSWRRAQLRAQLQERLRAELDRGVAAGAFAPDAQEARLPYLAEVFLAAADPSLDGGSAPDLGLESELRLQTLTELALRLVR
jgi:AcrR family transcriptional regulator